MNRSENRGRWLLLGLLAAFSLGLFLLPAFVIRPFRYQSEGELRLAIAVKRIAPALTVARPGGRVGAELASVAELIQGAADGNRDGAAAQRGVGGDGPAKLL